MSKQVMQRALSALEDAGTLTTYDWHPASIFKRFYASAVGDYVDLRQLREKTALAIAELRAEIAKPNEFQSRAIAIAMASGNLSVSEVQRKLCISYNESQELCQTLVDGGWVDGLPLAPSLKRHNTAPPDTEAMRKELDDALKDRVALAMELERVRGERDALLIACKRPLNYSNNVGKAEGVLFDDDGDMPAIEAALAAQGGGV